MFECCYRLPPKEYVIKYRKRHITHANYINFHNHIHFYGGENDFDDPIEDMGIALADPSNSFIPADTSKSVSYHPFWLI